MTDRAACALRLVAFAELLKRIKTADALARRDMAADLPVEGREPVWVPGPYGQDMKVGAVTHAKGSVYASVSDEAALIEWCHANRPDEVVPVTTYQLRPAFRDWLLAEAKKAGIAVDANGEEIPGITVREGSPTIKVVQEKSDDAIAALVTFIHSDPSGLRSLLELPTGGEPR